MSIRNLDPLFNPASVAVFGASPRPGRVGSTVWRNLHGSGYAGALWPVNPKYAQIDGVAAYPDVAALPAAPELAVICTPPAGVPALIATLGARGTRAAIVLTAGFDRAQRQALLDAARPHLMRILGPNGLGLQAPHIGMNASFAHVHAQPGAMAFVSQSGALLTAVLDWAHGRGIGFSQVVSLGEQADIDFGDMLDWLGHDPRTRSILLYIESIREARKFMSAARAAARNKPVIVVKSGRSASGQKAAASHTGALAGSDLVFDAAVRRAGMLRVDTLQELFTAAETLARFRGGPGAGVADVLTILTNGGGAGVLAADAAAAAGVTLAELTEPMLAALDAVLPGNWSRGNPVDIIGDAPADRYVHAVKALMADGGTGSLLFIHAPTAIVPSPQIAEALLPIVQPASSRVMGCWLGDGAVQAAERQFQEAGIACYETPEEAVRAYAARLTYQRNQALLMQAPPARAVNGTDADALPRVRAVVDAVLSEGRTLLTEPEAKAVLAACGIPVVATERVGPAADEVVAAAQRIGGVVALKILSADISHKSDVGGVALNLETEASLRQATAAMLERVARLRPQARIQGFTVQAMARRPNARELIVGASIDPLFGPVTLFGQGGTAVEVVADRAVALPPLNEPLARELIGRTRIARLLAAWRDTPAADLGAVIDVLMRVSQMLADVPEIAELDINPLLADEHGAIALDARIRLARDRPAGAARFAIRPYPAELTETIDWQGRSVVLRPIRPEDEAQHRRFLEALDPVDVRMRVFYSRRSIERSELARLTQIDYAREMAFIATAAAADGTEETLGVARATADPDNADAEFGIIVRSDLKGLGLGEVLMRKLVGYLRAHGTRRLVATVLAENDRMLELAQRMGFALDTLQDEPGVHRIELPLQDAAQP